MGQILHRYHRPEAAAVPPSTAPTPTPRRLPQSISNTEGRRQRTCQKVITGKGGNSMRYYRHRYQPQKWPEMLFEKDTHRNFQNQSENCPSLCFKIPQGMVFRVLAGKNGPNINTNTRPSPCRWVAIQYAQSGFQVSIETNVQDKTRDAIQK